MKDDFYYDPSCYLDSKAFKRYAAEVRRIVHNAESPVSIRDIHQILGEAAKPEWTMDALDSIRDIEGTGVLATRYRKKQAAKPARRAMKEAA